MTKSERNKLYSKHRELLMWAGEANARAATAAAEDDMAGYHTELAAAARLVLRSAENLKAYHAAVLTA